MHYKLVSHLKKQTFNFYCIAEPGHNPSRKCSRTTHDFPPWDSFFVQMAEIRKIQRSKFIGTKLGWKR